MYLTVLSELNIAGYKDLVLQVMTDLLSVLNNCKFPRYCNSQITSFLLRVPRFSVGSYSLEFPTANFVAPTS